jgi:hypothetical protein
MKLPRDLDADTLIRALGRIGYREVARPAATSGFSATPRSTPSRFLTIARYVSARCPRSSLTLLTSKALIEKRC